MIFKKLTLLLLVLSSSNCFSLSDSVNKIPEKDQKLLSQVKLQEGGLVILEQYLKKNKDYNGKDPYQINFICDKEKNKTNCRLVDHNVLSEQKSR